MLYFRINQNYICTEIKGRLNSGNACYKSVLIPLSSHTLSKNIEIKTEKIIALPVVVYGQ
jgi:hypothetical protein